MAEQEKTPEGLSPELLLLLEAFRNEWKSDLSALKAWGFAACGVASSIGGVITAIVGPRATVDRTADALGVVVRFFT